MRFEDSDSKDTSRSSETESNACEAGEVSVSLAAKYLLNRLF